MNDKRLDPVAITAYQCISAAGDGIAALRQSLRLNQSRLQPIRLFPLPFDTLVGEVTTPLPSIRPALNDYDCRNARLALKALDLDDFRSAVLEVASRYGTERIGIVLGTSTSGVYDSETAYVDFLRQGHMPDDFNFVKRHTAQATAEFLQRELALRGPCYAISTACSSSAKALGAAQRLIATQFCDAVLVAGVDSLCRLTLRGFHSLQLLSPTACAPMDEHRNGISIGEAAGLLLLEKAGPGNAHCPHLLAVGESSDAHHMSAPHPEGAGAAAAMRMALTLAGVDAQSVDYINLHATATPLNDLIEAKAVAAVFPNQPPCSGVKGLLGHTLGASGAVEAIVSLLALKNGFMPGTCGLKKPDPACLCSMLTEPRSGAQLRHALSNSFGFGGNNAVMLLRGDGRS